MSDLAQSLIVRAGMACVAIMHFEAEARRRGDLMRAAELAEDAQAWSDYAFEVARHG